MYTYMYRLNCSDIFVLCIWMAVDAKRMVAGFLHKLTADGWQKKITRILILITQQKGSIIKFTWNNLCSL